MKRVPLWAVAAFVVAGCLAGVVATRLGSKTPSAARALPSGGVAAPSAPREGVVFSATTQAPAATPDLLPAGVPKVYAFYYLPDAGAEGVVGAVWRSNGKSLGAVPSASIHANATAVGSGTVELAAPGGRLAPGFYELELQTKTRKFRASFVAAPEAEAILAQQAPADAAVAVRQHMTARGVKAGGEATGKITTFGEVERVFYVMQYEGAEPGMAVLVRWWAGQTEIKAARREIALPSTAGWAHAWMQADVGLPPGTYDVTATTAGGAQELARDQFTVR